MISFLTNWTEQIAIAVIIVSIFELILPKGNLKKYIKIVLGIYVVFCIISPFVNASNLFEFTELNQYVENTTSISNEQVDQTSMNLRLEKLYIEQIKNDIEKKVDTYGYKVSKCSIDADLDSSSQNPGIHSIDLVLKKKGIVDVEKVEISVTNEENIDTTENKENENQIETNSDVQTIKEALAQSYEISNDIIKIKINK